MKVFASPRAAPGSDIAPPAASLVLLVVVAMAAAFAASHGGVAAERIVVLLLVAPLAEEVVFRAGLHEAFLRRAVPALLANAATALAFGLAHVLVRGEAAALLVVLPALMIGTVYQRARRVRHCVLLHAAMNALWLTAGLAGVPLFSAP